MHKCTFISGIYVGVLSEVGVGTMVLDLQEWEINKSIFFTNNSVSSIHIRQAKTVVMLETQRGRQSSNSETHSWVCALKWLALRKILSQLKQKLWHLSPLWPKYLLRSSWRRDVLCLTLVVWGDAVHRWRGNKDAGGSVAVGAHMTCMFTCLRIISHRSRGDMP